MDMRLPGGGSFFDVFLDEGNDEATSAVVRDVSEADLVEALDAMVAGNYEYVGLIDRGMFLDVAGSGDGPYEMLQGSDAAGEATGELAEGVDAVTMRAAMLAYHRGDEAWRSVGAWVTPLTLEQQRERGRQARAEAKAQRAARRGAGGDDRRGGLLGRLFGR
jgi:hypothetical protein